MQLVEPKTEQVEGEVTQVTAMVDVPALKIDAEAAFSLPELAGAPPVVVTVAGPIRSAMRRANLNPLELFIGKRLLARSVETVGADAVPRELLDLMDLGSPGATGSTGKRIPVPAERPTTP